MTGAEVSTRWRGWASEYGAGRVHNEALQLFPDNEAGAGGSFEEIDLRDLVVGDSPIGTLRVTAVQWQGGIRRVARPGAGDATGTISTA